MTAPILIAEDDRGVRDVVEVALSRAGFGTVSASDGLAALRLVRSAAPQLAILDIGLPEMDGLELCRKIRGFSDLPIVFLTARDEEIDRILGLEMGGDDYVTKPFSPRELVARVQAILRRASAATPERQLQVGDLVLDPGRHAAVFADQELMLTATELEILLKLMVAPERVLRRTQLVDAIWGNGSAISDRTLDSHLRNLRAKLTRIGCDTAIETVHGVGLRMGPCRKV